MKDQGACTRRASQGADEVCSMPHGMGQEKPPSSVYLSAPSKPGNPAAPLTRLIQFNSSFERITMEPANENDNRSTVSGPSRPDGTPANEFTEKLAATQELAL